jgi:Ca2+-binding EF-hand superfamily protein
MGGLAAKLSVTLTDVELTALFEYADENKSGTIEFEEFQNFIMLDPYTKYKL